MIVRNNVSRNGLFGRQANFRMLDENAAETTAMFAIRETSWMDERGQVVAVHWDNDSGAVGPRLSGRLGTGVLSAGPLWGESEELPSSLGRLKRGSTVTVTHRGRFAPPRPGEELPGGEQTIAPRLDKRVSAETLAGCTSIGQRIHRTTH